MLKTIGSVVDVWPYHQRSPSLTISTSPSHQDCHWRFPRTTGSPSDLPRESCRKLGRRLSDLTAEAAIEAPRSATSREWNYGPALTKLATPCHTRPSLDQGPVLGLRRFHRFCPRLNRIVATASEIVQRYGVCPWHPLPGSLGEGLLRTL